MEKYTNNNILCLDLFLGSSISLDLPLIDSEPLLEVGCLHVFLSGFCSQIGVQAFTFESKLFSFSPVALTLNCWSEQTLSTFWKPTVLSDAFPLCLASLMWFAKKKRNEETLNVDDVSLSIQPINTGNINDYNDDLYDVYATSLMEFFFFF